jgi:hypothetical protein
MRYLTRTVFSCGSTCISLASWFIAPKIISLTNLITGAESSILSLSSFVSGVAASRFKNRSCFVADTSNVLFNASTEPILLPKSSFSKKSRLGLETMKKIGLYPVINCISRLIEGKLFVWSISTFRVWPSSFSKGIARQFSILCLLKILIVSGSNTMSETDSRNGKEYCFERAVAISFHVTNPFSTRICPNGFFSCF